MTFGFSTSVDALNWAVVLLLDVKVGATIILLTRDRNSWFETRWGAGLWWATKVTPILALPCMIAMAVSQHRTGEAQAYRLLMAFVLMAVPIVVWRKFRRPTS